MHWLGKGYFALRLGREGAGGGEGPAGWRSSSRRLSHQTCALEYEPHAPQYTFLIGVYSIYFKLAFPCFSSTALLIIVLACISQL